MFKFLALTFILSASTVFAGVDCSQTLEKIPKTFAGTAVKEIKDFRHHLSDSKATDNTPVVSLYNFRRILDLRIPKNADLTFTVGEPGTYLGSDFNEMSVNVAGVGTVVRLTVKSAPGTDLLTISRLKDVLNQNGIALNLKCN